MSSFEPTVDDSRHHLPVQGITGYVADKKAVEAPAFQCDRQFRLFVERVVKYAIFTLGKDGRVTDWNCGAQRITGYCRDEIVEQHYSVFFPPEDRSAGTPDVILAYCLDCGWYEGDGWRVRKDGTRFWANVVLEAMRDEKGELVGYTEITRDVTDRKELESAKELLNQAHRLETVGRITGGVAHYFNNFLAAISGSLELISMRNKDDALAPLLDLAQRAADRGAQLTQQLLAFSRRQTLVPKTSNINDLIVQFEILLRRMAGASIDLRFVLSPEIWLSDIDPAQLQSALLNLVANARDAMPKGGRLTIQTENAFLDRAAADRLTDIAPGAYVTMIVRDTGTGMTPEARSRAIEPFFTTKDVGRGSGLGLSQVYGFVRQSNGQMEIDSAVGRGTSITLYIPKSSAAEAVQDNAAIVEWPIRLSITVLIVEDDPELLERAIEAVRSFGYVVHSARNAYEALEILRRPPPVQLLFTDVVMPPGMNGIELAREACKIQPSISVLLTSRYPGQGLPEYEGVTANMQILPKPYTLTALRDKLKALNAA